MEPRLTPFLDLLQETVIVIGIVVGKQQLPHPGAVGDLDGLRVAAVSPTAMVYHFCVGILGVMDEQIRAAAELDDGLVDGFSMFQIGAYDEGFSGRLEPVTERAAWMVVQEVRKPDPSVGDQ